MKRQIDYETYKRFCLFDTAEFRVKTPGICWENCEIVDTLKDVNRVQADAWAQKLAALYGAQVRWNWRECDNGYYFGSGYEQKQ